MLCRRLSCRLWWLIRASTPPPRILRNPPSTRLYTVNALPNRIAPISRPSVSPPQHLDKHSSEPTHPIVQQLRTNLYHYTNKTVRLTKISNIARRSILRRERRKQLADLYGQLRQQPELLRKIARRDMIALVNAFVPSQSIQGTNTAKQLTLQTIKILQDMEAFRVCRLSTQELELLIKLHVSIDEIHAAEAIAHRLEAKGPLSSGMREQLAIALARQGRVKESDAMCESTPNLKVCAEQVNTLLKMNEVSGAEAAIQKHQVTSPGRSVMDYGLDRLITHMVRESRDTILAIHLFQRKRELGLSGASVARLITDRCMYTMQPDLAWSLLELAQSTEDQKSVIGIANGMIKQYVAKQNLTHAMEIYNNTRTGSKRRSLLPLVTRRDLMVALAHSNRVADAMILFRDLDKATPYRFSNGVYHTLLRGLIDGHAAKDVRYVYDRLQRRGIIPNLDTFHVLMTFCGRSGDTAFAQLVVQDMAKRGFTLSHKMYTSLMACYVQAGDSRSALAVFKMFMEQSEEKPDAHDFNVLLRTVMTPKVSAEIANQKIVSILENMKRLNVMPDDSTMITLLQIYDKVAPKQADALWSRIVSTGMLPNLKPVRVSNVMYTRMIQKVGVLAAAKHFFQQQQEPARVPLDGMTYKIFLDAATVSPATMGLANKFYRDMRLRGIKPPLSVYENMISGWSRKWQISKAKRVMVDMEQDYQIRSGLSAWTRLTDGFLANNQIESLHKLVMQEMIAERGILPDAFLEQRMVKALKDHNLHTEMDEFLNTLAVIRQNKQRKALAKTSRDAASRSPRRLVRIPRRQHRPSHTQSTTTTEHSDADQQYQTNHF
ncbi:hypothetical protein K450DRAFT_221702 [Umbelopsis ramanniana AG]|uniref:Pentatricopeptide repeat-containing protein-mitochondrial domain-containing protein n=1 Tax=Umbelopsis ramanniana AG TaxID=1314678 RepID=A0AAD5EHQ9_UMBRA|nr:uncharacterized protein K450DRAFT_221702 [Umbelopsis ramanniana AG]KAI8583557.1 hypothetical protein K450DRAFT_221702 [Umbelopsis ramanniana AG]